ncbi:hypothetical protein [Agromyces aureus]|uniref:hypothetical protein n=1 Tax=Agromyces aureus TaxID=453304 RepID=UPI0012600F13|nr:hypothetical protein [Agromyces aureus]
MPRAAVAPTGRRARRTPVASRARAVLLPLAFAIGVASMAGCTPQAGGPAASAPPAALPAGITASVLQSRQDVVDGKLVVQLDNATGDALEFAAFEVSAPGLEPGLRFEGPRTIPDGRSVQYRVELGGTRCDGDAGPAEVALEVSGGGGGEAVGTIEADDLYDTLPRLQNSGCLAGAVADVAAFTLAEHLRSTGSGTDRRAFLDISVEPTGAASGSVDLSEVLGTTLLSAEDGLNWSTTTAHIEASDAPSTISLPVRPARCDPHAGAEDKRGTILPLVVTTSEGWSGQYEVRASATLKQDLFAYFTERCGLPSN